jgi:hypothetical protein
MFVAQLEGLELDTFFKIRDIERYVIFRAPKGGI